MAIIRERFTAKELESNGQMEKIGGHRVCVRCDLVLGNETSGIVTAVPISARSLHRRRTRSYRAPPFSGREPTEMRREGLTPALQSLPMS